MSMELHATHQTRRRLLGAAAAVGLITLAAACGSDSKSDSSSDKVAVTGQWARTSPSQANTGAAYFTITSPTDDTLIGVKVDTAVAATAEMHEMVMAGSDSSMPMTTGSEAMGTETTMMGSDTTMMGTDTTMAGTGEMVMQPVASVTLPAGKAVEFKPGGYHVMLMELAAPLTKGSTIKLTLVLKNAGEIVIDVPVLDEAP